MSLDINTPRGQKSVQEEQEMLSILKTKYSSQFIHTPITCAALIDGFIVKNDKLIAIYESKCRSESLESFKKPPFNNEWLISHHKINSGASLSKALAVPFWGFLYLVPDRKVIAFQITDNKGNCIKPMRIERRKTSKCCNGGTMIDTCAFININNGIHVN
jgi:hypothetical protein